jgi:hypothetical protein
MGLPFLLAHSSSCEAKHVPYCMSTPANLFLSAVKNPSCFELGHGNDRLLWVIVVQARARGLSP